MNFGWFIGLGGLPHQLFPLRLRQTQVHGGKVFGVDGFAEAGQCAQRHAVGALLAHVDGGEAGIWDLLVCQMCAVTHEIGGRIIGGEALGEKGYRDGAVVC
jgi:hypothetical protein